MKLEIDQHRLLAELETLSAFSDAAPPAVTRIVFTPSDLKARTWLISRCEEAGLTVRQDAIGNIFARWNGADPAAPAVGTGSHMDAIPNAGSTTGSLESLAVSQRSARCSGLDSGPRIRSNFLCLRPKNQRASASAAWEAGYCREPFPRTPPDA